MNRQAVEGFYQVNPRYIEELYFLQVEMLKLQKHIFDYYLSVTKSGHYKNVMFFYRHQ